MSSEQPVASSVDQNPVVSSEPQTPKPVLDRDTVIDLRDGVTPSVHVSGAVVELVADDSVDSDSVHDEIERAEAEQTMLHAVKDAALAPTGIEILAQLLRANTATDEDTPPHDNETTRLFVEQHFVKDAPRFSDQVMDLTRTERFEYKRSNGQISSMTEHEGLVQLDELFGAVAEVVAEMPLSQRMNLRSSMLQLVETQVPSMRDELTFIGAREYHEGVRGLGERWKAFLRDNPDMQLCVVADVGELERYKIRNQRKSDDKLREDILLTFSPEEVEAFGPRIVGDIHDVGYPADKVKIVLIDDWSISGNQMRDSYKRLTNANPKLVDSVSKLGNIEINFLAAGEERIRNGFLLDEFRPNEGTIPVFAYYRSHNAPQAKLRTSGHISGLHSSVNWDFAKTIEGLASFAKSLELGTPRAIALGNVVRKYKSQPRALELTPDGIRILDDSQEQTS